MSTQYPSYLIHYNKNHSKANGQFVSGDGDGDGQVNDHKYSREQYNRDRDIYGKSGARRISKRVAQGHSVSGARSKEADKIAAARQRTRPARNIGGTVGALVGSVGSTIAAREIVNKYGGEKLDNIGKLGIMLAAGSVGGAAGGFIGKYSTQSISMLASGYAPNKFRG